MGRGLSRHSREGRPAASGPHPQRQALAAAGLGAMCLGRAHNGPLPRPSLASSRGPVRRQESGAGRSAYNFGDGRSSPCGGDFVRRGALPAPLTPAGGTPTATGRKGFGGTRLSRHVRARGVGVRSTPHFTRPVGRAAVHLPKKPWPAGSWFVSAIRVFRGNSWAKKPLPLGGFFSAF